MKIKLTLILATLICHVGFCQEYLSIDSIIMECKYLYEFQEDSMSKYSIKNQEMTLLIGKKYSKFASTHKLFTDSVIKSHSTETPTTEGFMRIRSLTSGTNVHSYCRNYVYKNYPSKGLYSQTFYVNSKYVKVNAPLAFNWNIIPNSTIEYMGYECQKATTWFAGRNYEAWFTTDIPISDGPYKFEGLPGLILKIYDNDKEHSYNLLSIKKLSKPKTMFFKQKNYVDITINEFCEALNTNNNRLINKIQQQDGIVTNNDETKAQALNNLKSRNNYIEKY